MATLQTGRSTRQRSLLNSFLPDQDRQYIAKARQIADIFDDTPELEPSTNTAEPDSDSEDTGHEVNFRVFRVQTRQSPYLDVFHSHHPVRITIDSGTTANTVRSALVQRLGCCMTPSSQSVHQADGSSRLNVVGETTFRTSGIGVTLYLSLAGKLHLARFFSAKLRGSQSRWLRCEKQILTIAVSTKHFSPYLICCQTSLNVGDSVTSELVS